MNRRNVVITEDELILIREVINDWFRLRFFAPPSLTIEDYREVQDLCRSLPLPDDEMEIAE